MFNRLQPGVCALALATFAGPVLADAVTLSGALNDAANSALVASDFSAAQVADPLVAVNNVALYALLVATGGNITIRSTGHALGGVDPYVSLFSGTDRASAGFVVSNYDNAFAFGGDFSLSAALAPGAYTVAIGAFANLSFAENLGSGVLADGFIGLGDARFLGDGSYAIHITLPDGGTVPEPSSAVLGLTVAWAAAWASRRRQTRAPTPPPQTTHEGRP